MSAKSREYDAKIAGLLSEAGARITSRGHDGAGHRVVGFECRGHERHFHYPSTGASRGHWIRNVQQRLKWLLDEIPEAPPEPYPNPPADQIFPPPAVVRKQQHAKAEQALPKLKLTKARRSEIVKRYTHPGVTIDMIEQEFGLTHKTAETLLLATAGAVRTKYEKERNVRRSKATQQVKHRPVPKPPLEPFRETIITKQRKRFCPLRGVEKEQRDRRVFVYYYYGMDKHEIAELFDLTWERVRQIIKEQEERNVR